MSTELTVIDKVKKHESAYEVYAKYVEIAAKAKTITDLQLTMVDLIDIKTVGVEFMEAALVPVVQLRTLLTTREKEALEARQPVTRQLDELKGYLMEPEKSLGANIARVAKIQNAWESEKSQRAKDAKKIADDEILVAKAKILRRTELTNAINKEFAIRLTNKVNAMIDTFHKKTAVELPDFGKQLSAWVPDYKLLFDHAAIVTVAAGDKYADIVEDIRAETFHPCRTEYISRLNVERNKVVDLIPSRITELTTEKPEVILQREMNFKQEVQQEIVADQIAKEETVSVQTQTELVVASFALPNLSETKKAKGSVTIEKYEAISHEAIVAIIQFWVKNELSKLTIEEANNKLSFMFTAANKEIGKVKIEAKGLSIVETISTRNQRAKNDKTKVTG